MRFGSIMMLWVVVAIAGCSSTKPPPEPDMTQLVPVNKEMPSELDGVSVLPLKTPAQADQAGDHKNE